MDNWKGLPGSGVFPATEIAREVAILNVVDEIGAGLGIKMEIVQASAAPDRSMSNSAQTRNGFETVAGSRSAEWLAGGTGNPRSSPAAVL